MDFNKRMKINGLLLASMPVTWEFWQVWKGCDHWDVSWFLWLDYPMNIQWYMRDLGTEITKMTFAILVFRLSRMYPALRVIARWVMYLAILGVVMFFVNYNRFNHVIVYSSTSVLSMFVTFFYKDYLEWVKGVKYNFRKRFILARRKMRRGKYKIKNSIRVLTVTIPTIQPESR